MKKNPSAHCCSSSRRKKRVRNATKHWICEKVKDWLIQDATLGASALQEKLKEHYKVTIHYKRVFDGKNLALKIYMVIGTPVSIICTDLRHKLRAVALVV